ncbi:MAG: flagellar biosynthesis anti-sigma factor FlgM [Deltaproteobacteria bacterium]|nr:flagellar biosynthesis anti-sigma factor FlgM [Deltaproteobacteria bacterium]
MGRSRRAPAVTSESGAPKTSTEVAGSTVDARKAIETAKAETARLDASTLASLKDAIAEGRYSVDADALADRILDDAFGDGLE